MRPYYSHGGVTIYHGDCREVLAAIAPDDVSLVLTDPPYGVAERTDRASKGRGRAATARDFPPVFGDSEPFDPAHLLRFRRLVLWGGNYFAERLPTSPSWLVWDKRDGIPSNDNADCEVAWTNLGGPMRLFRYLWNGMCRAGEKDSHGLHPTQKPVALMRWALGLAEVKPGGLVLDPYTGSGPVLVAAKQLGLRAIGVDVEERYCEAAARRLSQQVLDFGGAA